ncbi:ArsR/SmtB family transcription factor [Nocardioides sp.]|uniref:ArsR/SmtB family transcription factor n=1 Tax=Nocardioides sp. TaxID=35761 RepID=UPI0039C99036
MRSTSDRSPNSCCGLGERVVASRSVAGDLRTSTLRALAHPLRLQILSLLTPQAMSAAEIGRALNTTSANASYHLRVLHREGLIRLESEEKGRGGVARKYRYVRMLPMDGDKPATVTDTTMLDVLGKELSRRSSRLAVGPSTIADAELYVSEREWREIVDGVADFVERLHAVARPRGCPGTIPVNMTVALFGMGSS